ncbi:histidine phosphatase family protein [Mycobacterium saskatchewanense]|uniref:Histidine phosphatase n=1 Tax=Mycobacterium saskatchewanense TaxID=220927 RepID=A0AAJ3NS29_9MYCO|nr:histidine phosphatase family protein [Mycobacterium saskatchewanense]ORW72337.1 histidine phosphatase [Mycobacterium saskatchewanense]
MSDVLRLTLVSHAMTDAMATGRFPLDEPLSDIGRRQVKSSAAVQDCRHFAAPERRARETAELLGLRPIVEPRLADLDCGTWRGRPLTAIDPRALETWLFNPACAPHGGESIVDLTRRVGGWLGSLGDDASPTAAVTHPAVVRAAILFALDAPPKSFWRLDIEPVSRTVLHFRNGRWTLRS